jgi:hypothetical protein
MDEGPAVEVERALPEVTGEPGEAGEYHQRPDAAHRAALPRDDSARSEDETDSPVGDDEPEIARLIRHPLGRDGKPDRARKQREPKQPHDSLPARERDERRAGKLALRNEPARPTSLQAPTVGGDVAAGRQNHGRPVAVLQ